MSKEIIKFDEMEKSVGELTKFEFTTKQLKEEVEKTKDITVDNLEDEVQLERVKRGRIDLVKVEKDIKDTGLEYRRIFTKISKGISEKEGVLLEITSPEVERLKNIEAEAKAIKTRKEREIVLPYRKEKLAEVDNETDNEILLEMDDKQFGEYLMEKTEEKNEKEKLAKEEEEREEQKQKEIKEAEEKAKQEAEEEEKLLAKRKEFTDFREKLGYSEKTKEDFRQEEIDGVIVLFKKVGEFKK